MKRRTIAILIAILICAGAAAFVFVPYTPMPDVNSFQNVSIWRIDGSDQTEITDQVDQNALREVLTQVKASRVPNPKHSFSKLLRCTIIHRPSSISARLTLCTEIGYII